MQRPGYDLYLWPYAERRIRLDGLDNLTILVRHNRDGVSTGTK